jgi:MFS family permease
MSHPYFTSVEAANGRRFMAFSGAFWAVNALAFFVHAAHIATGIALAVGVTKVATAGGYGFTRGDAHLLLATFTLLALLLPAVVGAWVDRFGFKPALRLALTLLVTGSFVMAFQVGFWPFLAGCVLAGSGMGLFRPALRGLVAHGVAPGNGGLGWSIFLAVLQLASLLAGITATVVLELGTASVFVCTALVGLVGLVPLGFVQEPGALPAAAPEARPVAPHVSWRDLGFPALLVFLTAVTLYQLADQLALDHLPPFVEAWGIANQQPLERVTGYMARWLPQLNAVITIVMLVPVGLLVGRFRPSALLQVGTLLTGLGIVLAGATNLYGLAAAGVVLLTLGEMLVAPSLDNHLGQLAPPDRKARYMGYGDLPRGMAWALAFLLGDALYARLADPANLARGWLAGPGGMDLARVADATDDTLLALVAQATSRSTGTVIERLWQATHPQWVWVPLLALLLGAAWTWRAYGRRWPHAVRVGSEGPSLP